MVIIDFSETERQAFLRGFEKGLAAPVMLFGHFQAPTVATIPQITVQPIEAGEAIENDWKVIGADLRNVIERYGKNTPQTRHANHQVVAATQTVTHYQDAVLHQRYYAALTKLFPAQLQGSLR
jgi:hypothetical protein